MSAVAGVFRSQTEAEHAQQLLTSIGLGPDRVVLLAPGGTGRAISKTVPISETEQPGMGKAVGAVVGGAVGVAAGAEFGPLTAFIPGVGPVIAMGLLAGAVLGLAGGLAGARLGGALEEAMAKGVPADEMFIYEDALRSGRSIILAFPDEAAAAAAAETLRAAGAESINAARKRWWIGLRDLEKEHYTAPDRSFDQDEDFYRMGFEAALNFRNQGKNSDQVLIEKASRSEPMWQPNPQPHAAEAFRQGYERGQSYERKVRQKAA